MDDKKYGMLAIERVIKDHEELEKLADEESIRDEESAP